MEENTNNAITDTMMTSTPEQRNEAEAIFRFMSKLKANKPGAKLEEQLETLDSFFTADETSFNIEELDPYVVAFIEKICKDFCEKNGVTSDAGPPSVVNHAAFTPVPVGIATSPTRPRIVDFSPRL